MVRGPALLGTAISGLPLALLRGMVSPPLVISTVNVCCRLSPAAPLPVRDVIAGGTIGVPGGTGLGEFAGASMPLPAPTNPVKTPGARMLVWKRNVKTTFSVALWLLSTLIWY